MKVVLVSDARETLNVPFGEEEYILFRGAATVGGALFEQQHGDVLVHRDGPFVRHVRDIDEAKRQIAEYL